MSWWDDNQPDNENTGVSGFAPGGMAVPDVQQGTPASDDFANQVTGWYQQYLGRTPSADEINSHRGNPGGLPAVQQVIQGAAGHNGEGTGAPPPAAGGGGGGGDALRAQIATWAAMPGADPSLANNPDYWVQAINSRGGLTDANRQYWQDASVGPTAFFNNPNRESATQALPGAPANFGAAAPTYTAPVYTPPAPYTPPTWQGGAPPSAPTFATYTPPTLEQLKASPGYQARMDAGLLAGNRSAAANGTVLNGGTQQALARYGQDYASNEYGNLVGQGQSTTALNNAATQTSFGDAFSNYQARYGQFTDAANLGKNAYDTNYGIGKNAFDTNSGNQFQAAQFNATNQRNASTDYWQRLNDLFSLGGQLAGGSYKPPQ